MTDTIFVCGECGRSLPLKKLSSTSLDLAGTPQPAKAVASLDPEDVICDSCDQLDPADFEDLYIETGRTPRERFELCGIRVDPGMKVFYQNNY